MLNYMVTPSDHQCTNDGGHSIFISQSINNRCVCAVTPTMACCNVGIITAYYKVSDISHVPPVYVS